MSTPNIEWWPELFSAVPAGSEALTLPMRVLQRHGQPFLLLPASARHAGLGLQLYPAQRWQARVWRGGLALLFRLGLSGPAPVRTVTVGNGDPLVNLLKEHADAQLPPFAVLAGNSATAGRRFILVAWPRQKPALVLKLGRASGRSQELLEQEERFLGQIPESVPGIPRVLKSVRFGTIQGFALPYVAGTSPQQITPAVVQLLQGWLQPGQLVPAQSIKAWHRLREVAARISGWATVVAAIEARPFAATVTHGDFAPWNLRVPSGERAWALDWERGEFPGMPAWDWFHFVIQTAILVQRKRIPALVQSCRDLFQQEDFRAYAAAAGAAGRERALLLAYLNYVVHVLQPTEGQQANRQLLEALNTISSEGLNQPTTTH